MIKEKCGVDIALNYNSRNFKQEYEEATPDYVDIYFDNVGGEILDMNLGNLARWGRVVTCGAVSSYEDAPHRERTAISAKGYENIVFPLLVLLLCELKKLTGMALDFHERSYTGLCRDGFF